MVLSLSMSISPMTTFAHLLGRDILRPSLDIDEEADAKPSMDGAVPTMIYGLSAILLMIFPMSFITPEPTPITISQELS